MLKDYNLRKKSKKILNFQFNPNIVHTIHCLSGNTHVNQISLGD